MITLFNLGVGSLGIGICLFVYGEVVKSTPAIGGTTDGAFTVSLLLIGLHHVLFGVVPVGVLLILVAIVFIVKNVFYTDL